MRGKKWICAAIDRRMGGRVWNASLFFYLFILLSRPLVSLVGESIVSSERKSEQSNENLLPLSKLWVGNVSLVLP